MLQISLIHPLLAMVSSQHTDVRLKQLECVQQVNTCEYITISVCSFTDVIGLLDITVMWTEPVTELVTHIANYLHHFSVPQVISVC